jgi:NADH dehydrogenase/NADH:ubiquinone oxidoreductase subunit G
MKSVIAKNKKSIALESGQIFNIGDQETVGDFMVRVRKHVKDEYLEDLIIDKETAANTSKASAAAADEKTKPTKGEAKAAMDPKVQEEAAREKAEAQAAKVKAADEAKAEKAKAVEAAKAEKAKAAEEAKAAKAKAAEEAEALKAAADAEALEKRKELAAIKGDELIAAAIAKAKELLAVAEMNANAVVEEAKDRAAKMLESGSTGIDLALVEHVRSLKGKRVSFTPFSKLTEDENLTGVIIGCMCDKRVDSVFYKIKEDITEKIYHKNAATSDVTILEDAN